METETNMYEVAARHKKAGRLAVLIAREFADGTEPLEDTPQVAAMVREVAAAYGVNPPSDATIAVVRELLSPS